MSTVREKKMSIAATHWTFYKVIPSYNLRRVSTATVSDIVPVSLEARENRHRGMRVRP